MLLLRGTGAAGTMKAADLLSVIAGCEFQAPQKGLRLINVNAISFMP
jgi:hypothetical protein